jgi:hypothetical protein
MILSNITKNKKENSINSNSTKGKFYNLTKLIGNGSIFRKKTSNLK